VYLGYELMQWALRIRDVNLGENREKLIAAQAKRRQPPPAAAAAAAAAAACPPRGVTRTP
jgi:hypothetical protein